MAEDKKPTITPFEEKKDDADPPKRKESPPKEIRVRQLHGRVFSGKMVCITDARDRAFLVSASEVSTSPFTINPKHQDIEELPQWDDLIDAILPGREEMLNNIRVSLWLNGLHSDADKRNPHVRKNVLRHAWPYKIVWDTDD